MRKKITWLISLMALVFMQSCSTYKASTEKKQPSYEGTVFFTDGKMKSGLIRVPMGESEFIRLTGIDHQNQDVYEDIPSTDIERLEFKTLNNPEKVNILQYMPIKSFFGKVNNKWVISVAKGEYASAYVEAMTYNFDADGSINLGGMSQTIHHGNGSMAVIHPSFPVYMVKKGDKVLSQVAVKDGVNFEGSAFRSGISQFMADDPLLCERMREEKWDFDNIRTIVENYNPNRGDERFVIDGVEVEPQRHRLLTNAFDGEMLFYFETAIPNDKTYGNQYSLGLRTSAFKFITYGGELGGASARYIDSEKRMSNHGFNNMYTAQAIDEDFSKAKLVRFNTFVGLQLPMKIKKFYIVPAAHITFGGMAGEGYATFNYGPMFTLDFGLKLGRGNILVLGGGFRHDIAFMGAESKEEASAPGFEAYKPYDNLLFKIGYKF